VTGLPGDEVPGDDVPGDDVPVDVPPDIEALGDALPDDLQPAATRGPYSVPDNARRRKPAVVLAIAAAICGLAYLWRGADGVLVNRGFLYAAIGFALLAIWFRLSAKPVRHWEDEAVGLAKEAAGFEVEHARAQLAWRGVLGRPIWRVLLYGNSGSALRRGVFVVDAHDGGILEKLVEDRPAESGPDDPGPDDPGPDDPVPEAPA